MSGNPRSGPAAEQGHGASLPLTDAARRCRSPREIRGQALVEFAMVLLPVLLIVVGTIQFGLILGTHVSLTNATREAARAGTIYVYDGSQNASQNGAERCTEILDAAKQAFGLLSTTAPHFSASTSCTTAMGSDLNTDGYYDRWTNGDVVVSICAEAATPTAPCPTSSDSSSYCTQTDGSGCLVRVQVSYRSDVIVPFLDAILDGDGDGRLLQDSTATMVIN
jgi:Flp pilus assembly protein TadG